MSDQAGQVRHVELGEILGGRIAEAEIIETPTSTLFFAGDRVFKLRRPVHLGYADLRDRREREIACLREVERNRPLAPDVYLGVVDLRDAAGTLLDHMVVMRRLPWERRLSTLVSLGEPVDGWLRAVAAALADFHAGRASGGEASGRTPAEISRRGEPAAVEESWLAALEGLEPCRDTLLDPESVDEAERLAMRFLAGHGPLFEERVRRGRIRDGHGDLTAEHVYCLDDGPRIIHRVEFDQRLRVGDVLSDAGTLAGDLELLGHPEAGERFLAWYGEYSGQDPPPELVHLYIAYRAVARAGAACAEDRRGDPTAAERARRLLETALEHLRAAHRCAA